MADSTPPTLSDLFAAYGRALIAKVQMREFTAWGGGVMDMFRSTVKEHQEMEDRYVESVADKRKAADDYARENRN